jgi:outer membrane murein-binding lipoprotein Lpp
LNINTGATNAVNGRGESYTNYFHSGTLEGKIDTGAWWQVDLGNPVVVTRIVIRNRNDCCQGRLAKYDLRLLNQQREEISRYPLSSQQIQTIQISLPSSKRELVNQKLNALKAAEARMQESMKCLNQEINQRQSLSSDIYALNQEAKTKEEDVKTKHENVKAAKERAELLQDPYDKTTVWEGWFPMGRPLERGSIPVLWFLSIVFLSISFGLFLEMIGINIEIPGLKEIPAWFQSFFSSGSSKSPTAPASDLVAQLFGKSKGDVPGGKNINGLKL